jgi:hypothetical protein
VNELPNHLVVSKLKEANPELLRDANFDFGGFAPDPNGKVALARSAKGDLLLFDLTTQHLLGPLVDAKFEQNVAFSPNGSLVVLDDKMGLGVWDVKTRKALWTAPQIGELVTFDEGSTRLVVRWPGPNWPPAFRILDARSGTELAKLKGDELLWFDGKTAVTSRDGAAFVRKVADESDRTIELTAQVEQDRKTLAASPTTDVLLAIARRYRNQCSAAEGATAGR